MFVDHFFLKGEICMKKIFNLMAFAIVITLFSSPAVLGVCSLKSNGTACSMNNNGKVTGAAAPIKEIVKPQEKTEIVKPCVNCGKTKDEIFYKKLLAPATGLYGPMFAPAFVVF